MIYRNVIDWVIDSDWSIGLKIAAARLPNAERKTDKNSHENFQKVREKTEKKRFLNIVKDMNIPQTSLK